MENEDHRAFLIGEPPESLLKYVYVREKPYEAVILGLLSPGQLLHMPDDTVCRALLDGIPVYLWSKQPFHGSAHAVCLCRLLRNAELRLKQLGVMPIVADGSWITAEQARKMRSNGQRPNSSSRLTPLAQDILEGRTP